MNWEAIRTNLATSAVIAVLAVATGFMFGTSRVNVIANDVETLKAAVGRLEAHDKAEREFVNCAEAALQSIREGVKLTRVCELKVE